MTRFAPVTIGAVTSPRAEARQFLLAPVAMLGSLGIACSLFIFYPIPWYLLVCVVLGTCTWPAAMLMNSVSLYRRVFAVTVADDGITLHRLWGTRFLAWRGLRAVRLARRKMAFRESTLELRFAGRWNRRLDGIPAYPFWLGELLPLIEFFSMAVLGRNIRDNFTELGEELGHQTRKRWFRVVFFGFLAVVCLAVCCWTSWEYLRLKRLPRDSVRGEAHVLNLTRDAFNHEQRVEYSFLDEEHREHTGEAQITEEKWRDLQGKAWVGVRYSASDPSNFHLENGEIDLIKSWLPVAYAAMFGLFAWGFAYELRGGGRRAATEQDEEVWRGLEETDDVAALGETAEGERER